jgi:branched-subunit amino acid transport protein
MLDALKYVPPAVITAIIVPSALMPDGTHLDVTLGNEYLVAGLAATAIAAWTQRMALTVAVGMATLWLWRWLWALG